VAPGDDLAGMLADRGVAEGMVPGDVLIVAHKVISKAEGRIVPLAEVTPGPAARVLADETGKSPALCELILSESRRIVRRRRGLLICETHHGFVCANAGVDASNTGEQHTVTLLPRDPDASAVHLRARLGELLGIRPVVLISDSFGRPWRFGIMDVCLGIAGAAPLDDQRGLPDADGRIMRSTVVAVADEVCSAAELAAGKVSRRPVVLVRGVSLPPGEGSIRDDVVMPPEMDLFR
jgi:coenzyme F420-0:L-glutamate ligase / coenzyme F420-1:gamma-L-glutamate ligase